MAPSKSFTFKCLPEIVYCIPIDLSKSTFDIISLSFVSWHLITSFQTNDFHKAKKYEGIKHLSWREKKAHFTQSFVYYERKRWLQYRKINHIVLKSTLYEYKLYKIRVKITPFKMNWFDKC